VAVSAGKSGDEIRFAVPLYTVAEAARYVRVPQSTYGTWAKGYDRVLEGGRHTHGEPVITALPAGRGQPTIPFVGLAESLVLAAFRKAGVSLQHIRQAIPALAQQVGLEHALASERLYTDGAVILYDFAHEGRIEDDAAEELSGLTRVVDGQRVFAEVIRDYLRRITYADDGWAAQLVLPYGDRDLLRIRPDQAGGRPLFVRGRARLEDLVSRWRAGDRLAEIAADLEVPVDDLEDALRVVVGSPA
jgi:uncharacterized protein (DUF433 family)